MGIFKDTKVFWNNKAKRALWETLREALGFRSWADIFIKVAVVVATLIALGLFGPDGALLLQAQTYIIIGVVLGLAFVLGWIWNFISIPVKDSAEKDSEIAKLNSSLQSDRRRISVKEKLGLALINGNALMSDCQNEEIDDADMEARIVEWYKDTQKLVQAAFGDGELAYFQSGHGTVVYAGRNYRHQKLHSSMQHSLQRLTIVLQNADTKPIRDDFVIEKDDE